MYKGFAIFDTLFLILSISVITISVISVLIEKLKNQD